MNENILTQTRAAMAWPKELGYSRVFCIHPGALGSSFYFLIPLGLCPSAQD